MGFTPGVYSVCELEEWGCSGAARDAQGSSAEPLLLLWGAALPLLTPLKLKITSKMLFSLEKRRLGVFSNLTDSVIL